MSNLLFRVNPKGKVSRPVALWAMLMAVALFCFEANIGDRGTSRNAGLLITVLLGFYLGWQRRGGAVFFAPIASWFFAWPPLWLATMIHEGFVKGLFKGLFLITFGWFIIGGAQFIVLFTSSSIVRLLRGGRNNSGPEVVIFGPDDRS
jgi:hypothetical protein